MNGVHIQFRGRRAAIDGLTKLILNCINSEGFFASGSKGIYLIDIRQNIELPGVFALVEARPVFIIVKPGKGLLTSTQKKAISTLLSAGVVVFLAEDLKSFREWFFTFRTAISMQDHSLPFGLP